MVKNIIIAATVAILTFHCFLHANDKHQSGLSVSYFNSNSLEINWTIKNLQIDNSVIDNVEYTSVQFDDCNYSENIGKPELPYKEFIIGIPEGSNLTYSISNISTRTVTNILPIPVGAPFKEKSGITSVHRIPDYSDYNFLPKELIEISEPQYFREMPIVRIKYYPINYSYTKKSLQIIESAKITFSFKGGNRNGGSDFTKSDHLYKAITLNYEQAKKWLLTKPVSFKKIAFDGQGPWYKIEITEDGLYKISSSVLAAAGIDVSALDPRTIKIYNNGGRALNTNSLSSENNPHEPVENAIYVQGESDGSFDTGDFILFYGTQLGGWYYSSSSDDFVFEQHPYDTKNYYWLTFGTGTGKRIQTESAPTSSATSSDSYFWERIRFEDETHNLLSSGSDWYGQRFSGRTGQESFSYSVSNLSSGSYPAKFRIKFKGGSKILYNLYDNNTYRYEFRVYLNPANNPQSIINRIFNNAVSRTNEFLFTSTDYLLNGNNTVKIDYFGSLESCIAYLDWVEFYYPRDFVASNNYLSFYTNTIGQVVNYNITGFTNTEIKLFDITDPTNVRFRSTNPLQSGSLTFKLDLTNNENKRLIAASLSSPSVKNISAIKQYIPTKNLFDQTMYADLIIISPPSFQPYAEEIVDLRKTGEVPIEGTVVTTDDIFFYFGSGVKDPVAIRNFIRHAYNNWTQIPQCVLLFGDGHYDFRNISISDTNFIPPFEISSDYELSSRETDNFYTAINQGSSFGSIFPQMPIGRLPVESHLDSRRVVDKLIAYQNDKSNDGWQTVLTFVGDDQVPRNEWNHQEEAESLATMSVLNKFIKKKIYLTAYNSVPGGFGRVKPEANQAIIDQLNEGTLIMNYVGHGSAQVWAHENVFEMNRDLNRIQNQGKLTLFIAATCTFGKFDNPRDVSFTEALIWQENKGAIGVIAASRGVYSTDNFRFNTKIYNNLFPGGGPSKTLGEAFFLSSLSSPNYQKFHLFADPSMYVADPRQTVKITSIEPATLKALSKAKITGIIEKDSSLWQSFTGGASVIVNDAMYENVNTGGGEALNYDLYGPRIFKGEISVDNGEFGIQKPTEFIIPKSIRYQNKKTGRLTIYAWNENGYGDALGYVDTLLFYGTENLTDVEGPQIDIYFEGQENFNDGDFVSKNPTLIAEIYDENGINLTHEVGHVIEIQIDDEASKDITSFFSYNRDSYSEGKLKYHLENISKGMHELSIKVWDNLNNPTTEKIRFEAITEEGISLRKVVNYPNPFQSETEFTFHTLGSVGADLIIKIYTISGRLIKTIEGLVIDNDGFIHIPWDGRDEDGDLIANGVYPYKIILKKDNEHKEVIEKLVKLK